MKRFFILFAILAATISGAARSASMAEQTLPSFDRLAVRGFTDVTLVQGDTDRIALEGSPEYLRSLQLDVTDGELTIENTRPPRWWADFMGDASPARITLTYRKLSSLQVDGAATVRAGRMATDRLAVAASGATSVRLDDLQASELIVNGSGALKMQVGGRTVSQKVRMSGAGDYQAAKLDSETASIGVSGAGHVVVRVRKTLDVSVSGAGSVEYFGDPNITQDIRGVGSVRRRGGAD